MNQQEAVKVRIKERGGLCGAWHNDPEQFGMLSQAQNQKCGACPALDIRDV